MSATETPIFPAFNVPLSRVQLEWLGTLCAIWSQVEFCTEAAIYNVQGLSFKEGRQTTLPRDISKKATKLSALAGDHCQQPERGEIQALCERITAAAPRRNIAVHGHWCHLSDHDNTPAAVSWFKVPVEEQTSTFLPEELEALTVEACSISLSLYRLLDARGAFSDIDE